MVGKNTNSVRINIYVHDAEMRRQIKTMAAQKDLSISEYCLQAITHQLMKEQEPFSGGEGNPLKGAVKRARRFQARTFGNKAFVVSSADLIRDARKSRSER